jgi:hypothetical protein
VSIDGKHRFGPDNARLSLRTGRSGAAARAGHDLLIEVTVWEAALDPGDGSAPGAVSLSADSTSLRVLEGTGGMSELGDDDKASIAKTIDDDILHGAAIEFRSSEVLTGEAGQISVAGELSLAGAARPVSFEVSVDDDGRWRASAVIKQSDWGIKPYSTLFGALKVADEVAVTLEADPPG